jgi:hypothetical protein
VAQQEQSRIPLVELLVHSQPLLSNETLAMTVFQNYLLMHSQTNEGLIVLTPLTTTVVVIFLHLQVVLDLSSEHISLSPTLISAAEVQQLQALAPVERSSLQ